LVNRFPAIELVRFCNSGTEANLMALGAARVATGRDKVLVFSGAYHGGVLAFSRPGPINAPFDMVVASYNDVAETRSKLRLHAPQLAAVIVEPMLQSGGCIPASAEFLHMLRAETIGVGALLIFDEVVTSRLHPGGIHGALGLRPDLVTLGKYIGGGLSFGAFGGSRQVMNLFDPRLPDGVPHAGTFNNNTLSMAVAFAGLSELYTPDAAIALNARGEQLRAKLNALAKAGCVRLQFTGIGSIIAAHPTTKKLLSAEDAAEGELALRELLFFHLLERGVYIAKRGMISLALTTSEAQIRHLEESVAQFIEAYRHLLKDPDQN
jgi:glutamate-1-semialdehyde 2,1-aminomutase